MLKIEKIAAILKYQEEKNKLVMLVTGVELIPDEYKLDKHNINESFDNIVARFESSSELGEENCIHCASLISEGIAFDSQCRGCIYYEKGNECSKKDSLWRQASRIFREKATIEEKSKLKNLGNQLVLDLK